jgi:Ca2+-binding RTX toxin-like protein
VSEPQEIGFGVTIEASSAERYWGSRFNDRLVGTPAADVIDGIPGYDRLIGRGGDDQLKGSDGKDHLIGGAGHDRLRGNRDNDVLDARDGERDLTIHCGKGAPSEERALRDGRDPRSKSC